MLTRKQPWYVSIVIEGNWLGCNWYHPSRLVHLYLRVSLKYKRWMSFNEMDHALHQQQQPIEHCTMLESHKNVDRRFWITLNSSIDIIIILKLWIVLSATISIKLVSSHMAFPVYNFWCIDARAIHGLRNTFPRWDVKFMFVFWGSVNEYRQFFSLGWDSLLKNTGSLFFGRKLSTGDLFSLRNGDRSFYPICIYKGERETSRSGLLS